MAVKEKLTETSYDEIEWNVDNEIQLFFAMNGHKPVGKNAGNSRMIEYCIYYYYKHLLYSTFSIII